MQFALVDGERTAPKPHLVGTCPACGELVSPKCGTIRVHHWAHRRVRNCDPWWEHETPWHREWKNHFDKEFQEVVLFDEKTGEKHIADVRTSHELVIEFQRSPLRHDEHKSRERFYRNMIWVVDGLRLKRDLPRLLNALEWSFQLTPNIFITAYPWAAFPENWSACGAPVFFDFHDGLAHHPREGQLFCLLPGRTFGHAVLIAIDRQKLIHLASTRTQPAQELMTAVDVSLVEEKASAVRAMPSY